MESSTPQSDEPLQQIGLMATAVPSAEGASPAAAAPRPVILPAVLERSAFEYHLQECIREWQPVGYFELMLVRDIAWNVNGAEGWNEGSAALQRQRARCLPELALLGGDADGEIEDVCLAAAVSAPEVHLSEQHAQRRSRAFHRAIGTLLELQARRKSREAGGAPAIPQSCFLTEAACEAYLAERFEQGCYPCPGCGCRRGHYLKTRRSWECGACKRQAGLRAGTVAADSPLPLVAWFSAIHVLLAQPTIGTTALGIKLGISRSTTVRNLAKKIIAAMAEDNASERLAGLDVYFARGSARMPESGAPLDKNMIPDSAGTQGP